MQWFDGIDAALTKPERALLARLKRQARAGVNVSPYPGYDQYSKLCARYERKADLLRFQQQAEAFAFGEIIVGEQLERKGETLVGHTAGQPRKWLEPFNLPAKKRAYDQLKANWLAAGLLEYSQDARLFLHEQATEEARIIQECNGPDVLDRSKAARRVAIARRLFSALHQYVEDDLAEKPLAPAERWTGLLLNYSLPDLNKLLVLVGLLETAEPVAVADKTKPAQWVAVVAALYKAGRTRADKAALYRAFVDTYGQAVGSLRTFQGGYNEANEAAQSCYARVLARLGQS